MIIVNRHMRILAVWPLVGIWETDGDRSWIVDRHERFESVDFHSPAAQQQIADHVRDNLVPWLRSWESEPLALVRSTLEYELTYDRDSLRAFMEPTALDLLDDVFEAFWQPLWDGVFGGAVTAQPRDEYRVLEMDEARAASAGFEPDPPRWPWLVEVEADAARRRAEQVSYIHLLPRHEDRFLPREEQDVRFGRVMLAEGRMALDAARSWFLDHPNEPWPMPDAGPIPPTHGAGRLREAREVFCSAEKAQQWESERQRPVSFDELAVRLAEAGSALGLPADSSIESNVATALAREDASGRVFEPWKSWATIAQALLDAQEADLFLRL